MKKKIKTGDKITDNLYQAVIEYVEKYGGSAVVIGGIAMVRESYLKNNYGIMVRLTGKIPNFPKKIQCPNPPTN